MANKGIGIRKGAVFRIFKIIADPKTPPEIIRQLQPIADALVEEHDRLDRFDDGLKEVRYNMAEAVQELFSIYDKYEDKVTSGTEPRFVIPKDLKTRLYYTKNCLRSHRTKGGRIEVRVEERSKKKNRDG